MEEFLEWEERQPVKYEFDGFAPVAMVGVREAHAEIQANLIAALHGRLRGSPCRVFGSDLKVRTDRTIRYPDAMIVCGPRIPDRSVSDDPVVLFEILSESSAGRDRVAKNFEYRTIPSLQRYVIIEQGAVGAEVYAREAGWAGQVYGPGAVLGLPEAGIELPLDELYEGLDFTPEYAA
jgi:Uma2 family endonuclease